MNKKRNSKQLLIESLLELSRTIPVEKITVRDIVNNCGIGRQTFYNHFRDKYDLIQFFYSDQVNRIIRENLIKNSPWIDSITDVLKFFFKYRIFFKSAISEEHQLSFFSIYYQHTRQAYIDYISSKTGGTVSDAMLFQIEFNCYGAVNVVREWMMNDMNKSPEALGADILNAMPPEMRGFID